MPIMLSPVLTPPVATLLAQCCVEGALADAWAKVHENAGCPGVDGVSVEAFHQQALSRLAELRRAVQEGCYRPQPLLGVAIPKRSGGQRPSVDSHGNRPGAADRGGAVAHPPARPRLRRRQFCLSHWPLGASGDRAHRCVSRSGAVLGGRRGYRTLFRQRRSRDPAGDAAASTPRCLAHRRAGAVAGCAGRGRGRSATVPARCAARRAHLAALRWFAT